MPALKNNIPPAGEKLASEGVQAAYVPWLGGSESDCTIGPVQRASGASQLSIHRVETLSVRQAARLSNLSYPEWTPGCN
ncbi:MAG: hypothetical protein ABSF53_24755 [Terracidiphilus sp.]